MKKIVTATILSLAIATPALAGSDAGMPLVLQNKTVERVQTSGFTGAHELRAAVGDASENGAPLANEQAKIKNVSAFVAKGAVNPAIGDISENGYGAYFH